MGNLDTVGIRSFCSVEVKRISDSEGICISGISGDEEFEGVGKCPDALLVF